MASGTFQLSAFNPSTQDLNVEPGKFISSRSLSVVCSRTSGRCISLKAVRCSALSSSGSKLKLITDTFGNGSNEAKLWDFTPEAEGTLERPVWTGDDIVSKFVNALISFKPLFGVMKLGARQVLINTAEKSGIPWRDMVSQLERTKFVYEEKEKLENKSITYPFYYTQEFHAYEKGNLCWEAAFEVEQATMSMCLRAIPWESSPAKAASVLRGGWLRAILTHHDRFSSLPVNSILDLGCSVGISTFYLAEAFPNADVTGLDLSPYFLAVASFRQRKLESAGGLGFKPVKWLHAQAEDTKLESNSFDVISLAFVFHECPGYAIAAILKEAHRLLRPGGTIAITDNSPKSKVIQNLPSPIFTLMKATEPWSDDYYQTDIGKLAEEVGFTNVVTVLSDPRHRTLTATAT